MNLLLNNCSAVLNDIGRWFCNYSTDIFIQSGILIILLLIIGFLLRKRVRATFRYCIWMLALLKLMLPSAFSLPTGIGYWFGDYIPAQTSISKQFSNKVWFKPAGASAPQDPSFSGEIPQVHLSQASPETVAPAHLAIPRFQALTWQAVVFVLWFIGAAALSLLLIQRVVRLRSIKQEGLRRIAFEYRRYMGVSFKNVALKPNVNTDVKIETIRAFNTNKINRIGR